MQGLDPHDRRNVRSLLLRAAEAEVLASPYKNSQHNLQLAHLIGILLRELSLEYESSYDLRRRIDRILTKHNIPH